MRRTLLGSLLLLSLALWALPESTPEPSVGKAPKRAAQRQVRSVEPAVEDFGKTWVEGQVMVATDAADRVAARHGSEVLRPAGPAGYAVLATPEGLDDHAFRLRLEQDPDVHRAAPIGRIRGAWTWSKSTTTTTRVQPLQWHLDFSNAPAATSTTTGVKVAVIDSGLAYNWGSKSASGYAAASSMSGVTMVDPWDFVDSDAAPYDEHQHGTHIASLIASKGAVEGVAVGTSIMPLRVLDENNEGTEVALIDALTWARTEGAEVINLSLCFSPDYVPSGALVRTLSEAIDAGIVVVAAAGNDGVARVSYPAAHPGVIAVGAVAPASTTKGQVASYSNYGARLDVMAAGGDPKADLYADGYADGLLAETIRLGDPTKTGLYFGVGTSQAAALVSGAAAHLIAKGADADTVRRLLQMSAKYEGWVGDVYADGFSRGRLDVKTGLTYMGWGLVGVKETYHASVVAWLVDAGGGTVAPRIRVTITDKNGYWIPDAQAVVTVHGPEDAVLSCRADFFTGECTVDGPAVKAAESGDAWVVEVTGVLHRSIAYRPGALFFESEGLEQTLAAMSSDASLASSVLAFRWDAGDHPELGPVADSIMISDMATDTFSPPRVTLLTPALLAGATIIAEGSVDGTGLVTTPMFVPDGTGPARYTVYSFGTGLVTTPMLRLLILPATSLEGTELGLSALTLYEGSGLVTTPMFAPVLLGRSTMDPLGASLDAGTKLEGTQVGDTLLDGGWLVDDTVPSAVFLGSDIGGLQTVGESIDHSLLEL